MYDKESGTSVSLIDWKSLTPEQQAIYETTKYKIGEKVLQIGDQTADAVTQTAPVLAGLADLILPGLGGLVILGGSVAGLYKKWRVPLGEEKTNKNWVAQGAIITADVINELKDEFPEVWTDILRPRLTKAVADAEKRGISFLMPDEAVAVLDA